MLNQTGPNGLAGRVGDDDLAQIITVSFADRKVMDWGLDNRFAEAARRCTVEARRQPPEIAAALLRLEARYLAAEGGGV